MNKTTCPGCKREIDKSTLTPMPPNNRAEHCPYCGTKVIDQAQEYMQRQGIQTDEKGRITGFTPPNQNQQE